MGESGVLSVSAEDGRGGCAAMVFAAVGAEVVDPEPLCQAIQPARLRDFVTGVVLGSSRLHALEFGQCRAARRRIAGAVRFHEPFQQIRSLQNDAAARRIPRQLAELAQESRPYKLLPQRTRIAILSVAP